MAARSEQTAFLYVALLERCKVESIQPSPVCLRATHAAFLSSRSVFDDFYYFFHKYGRGKKYERGDRNGFRGCQMRRSLENPFDPP